MRHRVEQLTLKAQKTSCLHALKTALISIMKYYSSLFLCRSFFDVWFFRNSQDIAVIDQLHAALTDMGMGDQADIVRKQLLVFPLSFLVVMQY